MLESVIFDGRSTVISVSHKRTFTGAIRRAIQVRDRHCQHASGCDQSAEDCDVDHIVPHGHGGPTSQFNGRLACPPHNRHADKRECDARPLPVCHVDRLDHLRARIRWRDHRCGRGGRGGEDADDADVGGADREDREDRQDGEDVGR
jgi:hypothetical protein